MSAAVLVAVLVLDLVAPSVREWFNTRQFAVGVVVDVAALALVYLFVERLIQDRATRRAYDAWAAMAYRALSELAWAVDRTLRALQMGDWDEAYKWEKKYQRFLRDHRPVLSLEPGGGALVMQEALRRELETTFGFLDDGDGQHFLQDFASTTAAKNLAFIKAYISADADEAVEFPAGWPSALDQPARRHSLGG